MARPSKDELLAIDQRRTQVARFYLQGQRLFDIAELVGVSISTVSTDLKAVREEWCKDRLSDMTEIMNQQLDRIDLIEKTAWEAWDLSRKPRKVTLTGRVTNHTESGTVDKVEARVTEEEGRGNPAYLTQISWCVSERNRMLGLYAPDEMKWVDPSSDKDAAFIREALAHDDTRKILAVLTDRIGGGVAGPVQPAGAGDPGHGGPLANGSPPEPAQ
jgi:uncharacterized protein YjcR